MISEEESTLCVSLRQAVEEKFAKDSEEISPYQTKLLDDGHFLVRYLRARDGHVAKAATMMYSSLKWRDANPPEDIESQTMADDLKMGKMYMNGRDKEGRPIVIFRPSRDDDSLGTLESKVRFFVWVIEFSIARMAQGVTQMTWIIDMSSYHIGPSDLKRASLAKALLNTLQNEYPERVHRLLVVEPPWYFRVAFALIRPILSAKTLEKVLMEYRSKDSTDEKVVFPQLRELIEEDQLEVAFGGTLAEPNFEDFLRGKTPHDVVE